MEKRMSVKRSEKVNCVCLLNDIVGNVCIEILLNIYQMN